MPEDHRLEKSPRAQPKGSRKRTRSLFIWIIIGISSILLLVGLLFGLLQTQLAKDEISSRISHALSADPGRTIFIGRLEGLVPFRIYIHEIKIGDTRGVWLTVTNLVFSWSPLQLLRGAFHVDEVSASKVLLDRFPESSTKEAQPTKESKPLKLPDRLPNLTVEELAVPELHLGAEALGSGGAFKLHGSISRSVNACGLKAALRIARIDEAPDTTADLTVELCPKPSNLQIALEFSEAADGWVSDLAGLKGTGPLSLSLNGSGPESKWMGQLATSVGAYGSAQAAVELGIEETMRVRLQGDWAVGNVPGAPRLRTISGSNIQFLLAGLFQSSKRVEIEQAVIEGKDYRLNFVGGYDLKNQEMKSDLRLWVDDLSRLKELLGTSLKGNLALQASVSGSPRRPHGHVELHLKEIEAEGYRAGSVETKLQLKPSGAISPDFSGLQISVEGVADGLASLDGKPLPETRLSWALNGRMETVEQVSLDSFAIHGQHAHIKLNGNYNLADMTGALEARLAVADLQPMTRYAGNELPGEAQIELKLAGDGRNRSASGTVRGTLKTTDGFPSAPGAILGDQAMLSLEFDLENGRQLKIPVLKMASPVFQLDAQTSVDFAAGELNADWRLSVPQLAPLTPAVGKPMAGNLEARGIVVGPFKAFKSTTTIEGAKVSFDTVELQTFSLKADVAGLPEAPEGNVNIELDKRTAKIKGSTDFSLKKRQLAVKNFSLNGPGAMLEGNVTGDLDKNLYQGKIIGKLKDLAALGKFLQQPMAGSGAVNLELIPGKKGQDIKLDVKGTGISTPFVKSQTLSLTAGLQNIFETPAGSASVQVKDLQSSELKLKSFTFEASGDEKGMKFQGGAAGRAISSFDFKTRGLAVLQSDSRSVRLDGLDGKFDKYPIQLLQPFSVQMTSEQISLEKLAIGFGRGRLESSGSIGEKSVRFGADFKDLPLEISSTFKGPALTGSAHGSIRLSGEPSQPRGNMDLRLTDVRLEDPKYKDVPALTLTASAKLQPGALDLTADLRGLTDKPATVEAKIPAQLSIRPYDFTVPKDGRLAGRLNFDADLATLITIFPLDDQALAGNAAANLDLRGSINAPEVQGVVTLSNGLYENYALGTVLKDWNVKIRAAGQRFTVEQFNASDGAGGKIHASGSLEANVDKGFPLDLNVVVSNATLLHRSDVTSMFAGNLVIAGALNDLSVKGNVQVGPTEIQLPERLPPAMTELEVIEIHGERKITPSSSRGRQTKTGSPLKVALDVKANLPRRIFVRGWGLDSEWEGKLEITGSAEEPRIVGSLSSVRGKLDFLNKRFDIKKGVVTFYGANPPLPDLNIVAESKVKDITARVTFTGPASNPEMSLSSDPTLPSDEILARVMFGRNAASITPSQALQLAMLTKSLSTGGGSQLDFMSRTRRFLGLDALEFNSSEEGLDKGTLGIGKYLTEGVYLDLQKGVGQGTDKASVEVEITPNITIESEVGSDSSSGIGVNWKYDY